MKVINNAHTGKMSKYDGRRLYAGVYLGNGLYGLDNGRTIYDLRDGRYIDADNDIDQYAEVTEIDNATGDSRLLGWVKV